METLQILFVSLLSSLDFNRVSGLLCYDCNNVDNTGCGEPFKAAVFQPLNCEGDDAKCAIQRQPPNKDNWVGILRGCYRPGSLPGIEDIDGCREWENSEGFRAVYCFCDTDLCNGSQSENGSQSVASTASRTSLRGTLTVTIPSVVMLASLIGV